MGYVLKLLLEGLAGGRTVTKLLNTFDIGRITSHRDYLRGAASAFDLLGDTKCQYRMSRTAGEADNRAIADDWATVSEDLRAAVRTVEDRFEG